MSNEGQKKMRPGIDLSLGTRVKSSGISLEEFKASLPTKRVIKAEELEQSQVKLASSNIPDTCQACGQKLKR